MDWRNAAAAQCATTLLVVFDHARNFPNALKNQRFLASQKCHAFLLTLWRLTPLVLN